MRIVIFIIIYTCVLITILAQPRYIQLSTYFGFGPDNDLIYYTKYPKGTTIKSECQNFDECPGESPEQLLLSLISADDYSWDQKNYNFQIPSDKKYTTKSADDSFQLLRKLSFSIGKERYAIVKFYVVRQEELSIQSLAMKFSGQRWKIFSPDPTMTRVVMMFKFLSMEALDSIFDNEPLGVGSFDTLVSSVYSNGILDLAKAVNMKPETPYSEEENRLILGFEKRENFIQKFSKEELKCRIIFPLLNQKLKVYVDKTYMSAKEDSQIDSFFQEMNSDTPKVRPRSRFDFDYSEDSYSLLTYEQVVQDQVLTDQKLFKKNLSGGNEWVQVEDFSDKIKIILTVFAESELELLREINALPKETTSGFVLELNKKIKDFNNNIDLQRLQGEI